MSIAWILFVAFGAVGVALLLCLAWRWLARSWEVLDDDQLSDKLAGTSRQSPAVWMRVLGWLTPRGPRRLTYRRDKLGRFRKIWRG